MSDDNDNNDNNDNNNNNNNNNNVNVLNAKFRCGFAGCGFHTNRLGDMCDHTLQVDHRSLNAWRCGVNGCETTFNSQRRLAQHRFDRHAVPPPVAPITCGAHPQKTFCIGGMCRGAEMDRVVELIRQIDTEQCELERQVARVRARIRPQIGAMMVRPLPRFDHLLQHLIIAVAEHDWPRPPPADDVCGACLQSYDQHAFVRCGERLPVVDAPPPDANDDDAAAAGFAGPNCAWNWERAHVFCGRSYHTYCLVPQTTITSGDIWLAAHVRARDFCLSLPSRSQTSLVKQTEDDHWRCSECALGAAVARPLSTPADESRLAVPLLDALQRAMRSGHASPYVHRSLTTLLQIFTACPINIVTSLQIAGCIAPNALVEQRADGDDERNNIASALHAMLTTVHGQTSQTPLARGKHKKRKEPH